ncbi:MAG: RNA-binding protein [Candidatus Altiarchaeum hamiconexum]|uniref:DNA/RNA-binding protein Alba n=1 Tax=Candidatus Altarchaeum hamiconexum TaxID=1803513 RepID=A0A8J8CKW9_9ARCH|nr:RNA-binding protein [Candidatus Altarchaeum hamiconexum]PIN68093.1 MAG: RNA-binding protein [Candidatus Altarchaeum sp. CG12_big_fil_rev_8_21_14_0_65_33_22]PIV28014.1 MAG: RNA-binding protein [Candidatus Altarchaeum sp. CG03_land_8_20_14_0_80_32_618]PIZ32482.1 MAG: RNA-binding protein [Candidatus Altarchaeum sp. CG_4_10_14_0_8_um_filter_32_851]PJC14457.1 MAG: RNA-binding protein [Candidatus Altarchaeum sp. CG_4_9_14_0_8_um_filter_32_206]
MEENNNVFVGKKELMAYVLAVMTQFTKTNSVVVKARGRSMSTAIDIVEVVRNKYLPNAVIKNIVIKTEEVPARAKTGETEEHAKQRGPSKVSAIEITLEKPPF